LTLATSNCGNSTSVALDDCAHRVDENIASTRGSAKCEYRATLLIAISQSVYAPEVSRLIRCRFFYMIDDKNLDRCFRLFELEM
jgi:hypothetical protein